MNNRISRCIFALILALVLFASALPIQKSFAQSPTPFPGMTTEDVEDFLQLKNQRGPEPNEMIRAAAETKPAVMDYYDELPPGYENWSGLVFQFLSNNNWEIAYSDININQAYNLTQNPASDTNPVLQPGGDWIVFSSNRSGSFELYKIKIDGTQLTRLTYTIGDDYQAAWSPDGKQIAFVNDGSGTDQLYLMYPDGSGLRKIDGNCYNVHCYSPSYSLDGSLIAYLRQEKGSYYSEVWTVTNKGSSPALYTQNKFFLAQNLNWLRKMDYADKKTGYIGLAADEDSDYWIELFYIEENGSIDPFIDFSSFGNRDTVYTTDALMGSWRADNNIIFTKMEYEFWENKYYLSKLSIDRAEIDSLFPYYSSTLKDGLIGMLPNIAINDITPPHTTIKPLPEFSRVGNDLTIDWQAEDIDLSGLKTTFLERKDSEGVWWRVPDFSPSDKPYFERVDYQTPPGNIYQYRMKSQDYALNTEEFPANDMAQIKTTLYLNHLVIQVTNNRGEAIWNSQLEINPGTINSYKTSYDGETELFIGNNDTYLLNPWSPEYLSFDLIHLNVHGDRNFSTYLYPTDNIIANNGFETAPDGDHWSLVNGTITRDAKAAHTGSAALSLGPQCQAPCLANLTAVGSVIDTSLTGPVYPPIETDANGNLYLFQSTMQGVSYRVKPLNGVWGAEIPVNLRIPSVNIPTPIQATVSPDGEIHLFYYYSKSVFYTFKGPDESEFSYPTLIKSDIENAVFDSKLDKNGTLHLLLENGFRSWFGSKPAGGIWSIIAQGPFFNAFTVSEDGTLHITYGNGYGLFYTQQKVDGTRNTTHHFTGYRFDEFARGNLEITAQNYQYLQIDNSDSSYFLVKAPEGSWRLDWSTRLDGAEGDMSLDATDRAHIYGSSNAGPFYRMRSVDGSIIVATSLGVDLPATARLVASTIDANGSFQILALNGNDLVGASSQLASTQEEYSASQTVTIPADMYHPTLSWMSRMGESLAPGSQQLQVEVTSESGEPLIWSRVPSVDWELDWLDLSAFAGQTVTVTFRYILPIGEELSDVVIDSVSLGSSSTPTVTSIDPAFSIGSSIVPVTIHGENFITTPKVFIGCVALTDVVWVDANTLTANVPLGLPLRWNDVIVENPGGASSILPRSFYFGQDSFLPDVMNNR